MLRLRSLPLLVITLCTLFLGLAPAAPVAASAAPPTPIWIDSDTGVDDAVAIAALLRSRQAQIVGISSVAGNATVEDATNNILALLDVAGRRDVPVVYGAAAPLVYPLTAVGAFIHGSDGLWNAAPRRDLSALPRDPAAAICNAVRANPNLTLLALGPMTNVALAARRCQADLARVPIVALNGAKYGGNRTAVAETNTFIDPHATAEALHSDLRITVFPLDAFDKVKFDARVVIPLLENARDPLARFLAAPLKRYVNAQSSGQSTIFTLPDLIAALYVLNPSIATPQPALVVVHLENDPWRGSTIIATTPNEMVTTIADDAELSALVRRVFSEPGVDVRAEMAKIILRRPANAQVVLSVNLPSAPLAVLIQALINN